MTVDVNSHPSVTILTGTAPAPGGPTVATGTWFVTGTTQRGPVGTPVQVRSLTDYAAKLGTRDGGTILWDAAEAFFRTAAERGQASGTMFVSRIVGADADTATVTLKDNAGTPADTLTVDALGPGTWGNDITIQVVDGSDADTYVLIVKVGGAEVERSGDLADPQAAVQWAQYSDWIRITDKASETTAPDNNPKVTTTDAELADGADDDAGITEDDWTAGLTAFTRLLGCGQVSAPGRTTAASAEALCAHAEATNRSPLLDLPDAASAATLIGAADAARAGASDPSRALAVGPWLICPGVVSGTTRVVPPSAAVAGAICRADRRGPWLAPAGTQGWDAGVVSFALAPSQTYSDSDWDALTAANVNLFVSDPLTRVVLMGYRGLSKSPAWKQYQSQRMRMVIVARSEEILKQFLFEPNTLSNRTAAGNSIRGLLAAYAAAGAIGASYGVDMTSPNTPEVIASGMLRALVSWSSVPFAEHIVEELVQVVAA